MAERIAIGRKCPTIERWRNQGKRTGNWGTAEKWFKHMNKCFHVIYLKYTGLRHCVFN